MTGLDLSRVEHLELRQRIAALLDKKDDVEARESVAVAALDAEKDRLDEDWYAKREELEREYRARRNAARAEMFGDLDKRIEATRAPFEAEREALGDEIDTEIERAGLEALAFMGVYDGYFARCRLSGLPMFDDEETVDLADDNGDEHTVLRAVLPRIEAVITDGVSIDDTDLEASRTGDAA